MGVPFFIQLVVTVNQLGVHFGQRDLFKGLSFFISERERIGLVGKNGAGKSTLMKIIAGIQPPTSGEIVIPKERTVGYLPQEMNHAEDTTILEEAGAAFQELNKLEKRIEDITKEITERTDYESDAYAQLIINLNDANDRINLLGGGSREQMIQRVLQGLGFQPEDMNRKMSEFSGGWKMRVELAKLLLQQPDVLLLDEPTNHLDIESIEWLEGFLQTYAGSIILISHDRTFLDNLTSRTIEITSQKVYDMKAPYSKYMEWRVEEIERQQQAYKNQQKYIEDTQKLINKFRAKKNKAAFAQTLIRKLEKLEHVSVDDMESGAMRIKFPPAPRSGKVVLKAEDLKKEYDKPVFREVDLLIARQEKVALVGKNGAGKTTLTRIITGTESFEGEFELGHNVEIGYYAQNQTDHLDPEKSVFEVLDDEAKGEIRTQLRSILGAFLFSGEDIDKKVKVLSGGEKARLALCKLLLQPCNLLILDEPTNHLDIRSKDVLKQALMEYDGTMIVVSHDRDFLSGLTELVYEVTPSGLKQYIGDIQEFLKEKRADSIAAFEGVKAKEKAAAKENSDHQISYKERKALDKERRKIKNRVSKLETQISEKETSLEELNEVIASLDYSDKEKTEKTLGKFQETKAELEKLIEDWEAAVERAEELGEED